MAATSRSDRLSRNMQLTIIDKVGALIRRLSPNPICDDCITERLDLSVRQHANHKTRELAGMSGFARELGRCTLCASTKKVIRYRGR